MKRFKAPIVFTSFLVLLSLFSFGQRYSSDRWFVDINLGPTIFIGDIRSADFIPSFEKPIEIGYGFGFVFGKEFGDYFNVRSQFLYGRVNGVKPISDYNFETNYYGAGLGLEINLNTLFTGDNSSNLNVFGTLGANYLMWNADLFKTSTSVLSANEKTGALSIPVGLKLSYEISPKLFLSLEGALHIVTSDLVDAKPGGITHDDINYNAIGLTYKFEKKRKRRKSVPRKNLPKLIAEKEVVAAEEPIVEKTVEAKEAVQKEAAVLSKKEIVTAEAAQKAEEQKEIAKEEEQIIAKVIAQEREAVIQGKVKQIIEYRVSILNTKFKNDPGALQKRLGIPETVVERIGEDGSYVYSVGSFDQIWKAKELRNRLITESNVRSATVVVIKKDVAISLRELQNFSVEAQKSTFDKKKYSNSVYKTNTLEHTIPDTGLVFGIQILSVRKDEYPLQVITDLYDIKGKVLVDKSTKYWAKFIVTEYAFEDLKTAELDLRKKGFIDAFIVAYYNGKRIPPSKIGDYIK